MFDKLIGYDIIDIHRLLTIESKFSIFSKILLGTETLFGPTLTKSVYFGGGAFLIRKIIEWMM